MNETLIIILGIWAVIATAMYIITYWDKKSFNEKFENYKSDVEKTEELRNSGRIAIPVTFGGYCKYVYSDATPKEFAKQFGAPWKTETHNNVLGVKSLCLTYCDHHALSTEFMHVWFNENYRLDSIHTNN